MLANEIQVRGFESLPLRGGSLKGGYSVSGNQLVKVVDGKTELQKVGGQVVNIVFQ